AGTNDQLLDNTIRTQTGHVKVQAPGYTEAARTLPLDLAIDKPSALLEKIEKMPEVDFVTPHIQFGGSLSNGVRSLSMMIQAVDPSREALLNHLNKKILAGTYLKGGNQILVGKKLAQELRLKAGDTVSLVATTAQGAMNAADLEITGIFQSGLGLFDETTAVMPFDSAQTLLNMQDQATDLTVYLKSRQDSDLIKRKIDSLGTFEVRTWQVMNQDLTDMMKMKSKSTGIVIGVIMLIAIFSIVNTMLMSVTERIREIGTMLAMGTYQREIVGLFLCEGGVLGVLGGMIGALFGGLLAWYFATAGFNVSSMSSIDLAMGDVLYGSFSWGSIAGSFLFGVLIAVVAAVYPAWMASRLKPIEALRHV
ncbi:MAG TPA: FtsX-like permease family protein, partial [Chroococcales cyanobacterium]